MQEQLTKARSAFGSMPIRGRLTIIGVGIATIAVMFLILRAATGTDWVPVASGLPADKLGRAQTVLDEAGIENRISPDRTAVEVPSGEEPRAANALIPEGIAAKGGRTGCAKQSEEGQSLMAQTSAQHALMLETCRENDAANTIESFDGVSSATVDVTVADKSLFADEQQPAKASVTVDTAGGGLSSKAVKGIQATVAGGFEGLNASNVTVMDETGAILGGGEADAGGGQGASMAKLQAEAALNEKIERDLMSTFEQVVGAGNVVIKSNVELDMDKIDRNVIENQPAGEEGEPLVEVENYAKELLSGQDGATTGGVTGTAGQDTDGTDTDVTADTDTNGDGQADYVSDKARVQYANNKVAEAIQVAPGAVVRFRISTIIDDDVDETAANAVKDAVQAWMGGNAQDSFSFTQAPIAAATKAPVDTSSSRQAIADYIKWALVGLGLIGLAFVLRRSLTKRTAELLTPPDEMLLLDSSEFSPIPIAELEAALAASMPSPERRGRIEMQRRVETIAQSKPGDVASELRRWMNQDDPGYTPQRKAG